MRKITQESVHAFVHGQELTKANMHVHHDTLPDGGTVSRMYLHGNMIAENSPLGLKVTLAGWPTPTTLERINGLLTAINVNKQVFQKDHAQFIGSTVCRTACEIHSHEWITV